MPALHTQNIGNLEMLYQPIPSELSLLEHHIFGILWRLITV